MASKAISLPAATLNTQGKGRSGSSRPLSAAGHIASESGSEVVDVARCSWVVVLDCSCVWDVEAFVVLDHTL